MPYTFVEQRSRDVDFFAFSSAKCYHFASAGGPMPRVIVDNDVLNESTASIIGATETRNFEIEINPNLREFIVGYRSDNLNAYTRDFANFARKGFYSFDRTNIGDRNDTNYHLVASPIDDDDSAAKHWQMLINRRITIQREWPYNFPRTRPFDINRFFFQTLSNS